MAAPGTIAQFQMPGDKIGVEMSEKYVLDSEAVLGGKRDVLVSVALWINDSCRACRLVSNQVGGVRQARQIELLKDHGRSSPFGRSYFGWGTIRR